MNPLRAILDFLMDVLHALQDGITPDRATQVLDQLRDPLSIGLAAATAVLAYFLAAPLEHAVAAGAAVLVVRTGAGLFMPVRGDTLPSPNVLTDEERTIAKLIGEGKTDAEIAERRGLTMKALVKRVSSIQRALGYHTRWEVAVWAAIVFPQQRIKREALHEKWVVRTILMTGGFISLGLSLYNIAKLLWPEFFAR